MELININIMKKKKIIYGLSIFAVMALTVFNVQTSLTVVGESGDFDITELIALSSASAEEGGDLNCTGGYCERVGGDNGTQKRGTKYGIGDQGDVCCGKDTTSAGKRKQ